MVKVFLEFVCLYVNMYMLNLFKVDWIKGCVFRNIFFVRVLKIRIKKDEGIDKFGVVL